MLRQAPAACQAWLHERLICRTVCVLSWWSVLQKGAHGVQVPLLSVLESAQFERMRGRSPLFQTWFDIQPGNLESPFSLEGLHAQPFQKATPSPPGWLCLTSRLLAPLTSDAVHVVACSTTHAEHGLQIVCMVWHLRRCG